MEGLDLRGLARNIGKTLVRQATATMFGLATIVIIARVYGPEGNGVFAVALLLPSMLMTFLSLGVASANVYHIGSGQMSVHQVLFANLRVCVVVGVVGLSMGGMALAWRGEQVFPGIDPTVLWFALAIFPISLLNAYLHSIFQGLQRFRAYNLLATIQPGVLFVLVVGLVVVGSREISLLVGAQLIAQVLALIIAIRWLMPLVGNGEDAVQTDRDVKKTVAYGWKAHLSNILTFFNYKADVFLINLFLGPTTVGVYVIAVAIAEKLWLISQAVSMVMLPRLSQLSTDNAKRNVLTPLITRWVLFVTFFGAIVVFLLAGTVIELGFGSDYSAALVPLWILLPGVVLSSVSRVLANDIAARGRPELNMYTSALVVIVNIIGNLILIPFYGLAGAATATTIAYTLNLILRLVVYGRFTKNRWIESIFIKQSDLQLLRSAIRESRA